jgi:signal recognition particle subunit SRP54
MFNYLAQKLGDIFSKISGQRTLSQSQIESSCDQVFQALMDADVPYEVGKSFLEQVKQAAAGAKVTASLKPGEQFIKIVYEQLVTFLGGQTQSFTLSFPATVVVLGLQGAGKTTFLGKLAHQQKNLGVKSILLSSVDFQRPAAIDQLEQLSRQVGVSFYRALAQDPVAATEEIIQYSKINKFDLLLLDTAGRLHVDEPLLQQLKQIISVAQPTHKLLVLDGMTGQESLNVAEAFNVVGYDGVVMTKMDGSARGGAAFAFRYQLHKPIFFLGMGEKLADLQTFHPDRMAQRILGMGDILSLIEQADAAAQKDLKSKEEQEQMNKRLMSGQITLEDFGQQLEMLSKLGSLTSLTQYLPGAQKVSEAQMAQAEKEMRSFKAMMRSMTPKERRQPGLLNGSRKARIAKGSGTTVAGVNQLLARFEQCQQFAKLARQFKSGRGPKWF